MDLLSLMMKCNEKQAVEWKPQFNKQTNNRLLWEEKETLLLESIKTIRTHFSAKKKKGNGTRGRSTYKRMIRDLQDLVFIKS